MNTLFSVCTLSLFAMATITDDANSCVQRGIARFWEANLTGSLEAFAEAIAKDPRIEPYLWQRGIC
ncbi:MAG TPA: hypothetical protein QF761_03480, partial [Pirellulales bacterium]|nr:hypothetical protein [Pirellulales bacterium]